MVFNRKILCVATGPCVCMCVCVCVVCGSYKVLTSQARLNTTAIIIQKTDQISFNSGRLLKNDDSPTARLGSVNMADSISEFSTDM